MRTVQFDPLTHEQRYTVLIKLMERPDYTAAAKAAGTTTAHVFYEALRDPDFEEELDEAMMIGAEVIQSELVTQALSQHRKPVREKGQIVYGINSETGKSEPMYEQTVIPAATLALIKALKPRTFGDRTTVTHEGAISLQALLPEVADTETLQKALDDARDRKAQIEQQ